MTEPRRVRTQAERDADGTTWHPGGTVRGEPVPVELDPGECVLVIREGVGVMCVRADHDHDPGRDLSPVARVMAGLDPDIWVTTEPTAPLRRRWWHRLTRRNP